MEIDQLVPCKKVYFLDYLGNKSFHHVYAPPMSKWLIANVKLQNNSCYCSLVVDQNGVSVKEEDKNLIDVEGLQSEPNLEVNESGTFVQNESTSIKTNPEPVIILNTIPINDNTACINSEDGQLQFKVPFNQIVEVILPTEFDKDCVSFIVNQGYNQPLMLHVCKAANEDLIKQIGATITNFMSWYENPASKGHSTLLRNVRLEDMDSIRFEVMLLGKIYIKPDAPTSMNIVDEAVDQYRLREKEYEDLKKLERMDESRSILQQDSHSAASSSKNIASKYLNKDDSLMPSVAKVPEKSNTATPSRKTSFNLDFDKNKTRIFQVGKQAFTLIASDQTSRNIEVMFRHVTTYVKGSKHPQHFGIQYKEPPRISTATKQPHTDEVNKIRCFVIKCSDESVCSEILQALKQASSTNLHGPDPLLEYHTLCRRVNAPLVATDKVRFDKGMNVVARFISDILTEAEQKKLKQSIEETCKKRPPKSRYEHLVIIMELIRQVFEERQNVHDITSKQSPVSSGPSAVSKHFNLLKSRAKRSFFNIESFWEKKWHDYLRDFDLPTNSSNFSPKRNFSDNGSLQPKPTYERRKSSTSSTSTSNTPQPLSKQGSSTTVGTPPLQPESNDQGYYEVDIDANARPRSVAADPSFRQNPNVKKLLDASNDVKSYGLFLSSSAATNTTGIGRGRSYSSPYLRRLLHILPDVQESPCEGGSVAKMKRAKFSFSRLIRGSDNSSSGHTTAISNTSKDIEMTSFRTSEVQFSEAASDSTRKLHANPVVLAHVHEEKSAHSSDVSSDEDDRGIIFTARTPRKDVLQPFPKVGPVAPVSAGDTPALASTPISARRHSAFSEVKPNLKTSEQNTEVEIPAASKNEWKDSETFPDYDAELHALEEKFGITIPPGGVPQRATFEELALPEKLIARPQIRTTIHQKIFKKIGTSRSKTKLAKTGSPLNLNDYKRSSSSLTSANEIRQAWQRAIKDQMLLNKIQKLSINAEKNPMVTALAFQIKEETDDDMIEIWKELLYAENRPFQKIERGILRAAVMRSVPAHMRGKVWFFLYEQWKFRQSCCPTVNAEFTIPSGATYDSLLKELTSHQHAILIDLGRTFPTHPYFSRQLGNGQLGLYNLLKAYSLMDEEVGYCQGLSFVAGVLLMNMTVPNDAFQLLCHLMIDMNCRKLYLPDMAALRVALYQLSRLLYDFHSDLFQHFEENEITLMLFSTPWFLTMFASVLSLDFTARVFDMLFLEGLSALFKTALCLLGSHKEKLLQETGFENIMGYLKTSLPQMDDEQIQRVITEMFMLDIGQRLRIYEAEYHVLEETDLLSEDHDALQRYVSQLENNYKKLADAHRAVVKQHKDMFEQLKNLHKQTHSLRQGLFEMGKLDERRVLELDELKKENEFLRQSRRM